MTARVEWIGLRSDRLVVVAEAPRLGRGKRAFLCHCDCGAKVTVLGESIRSGNTKSCGCRKIDQRRAFRPHLKHGGSSGHPQKRTATYRSWLAMRARCNKHSTNGFENYGGRGIRVCKRWDRYEAFLADMGERPEGMSIDRIDPDGNYEPGNCRWATAADQRRNQRSRVSSAQP